MKPVAAAAFAAMLAFSPCAHAWFFFFIPGSVLRSASDALSGAKGNICVKEGAQAGQVLNSPNGNSAKVVSVSGTSSICQNPALPIRAELEFTYKFSSKAGIELPDDFQPGPLSDVQRSSGFLLKATSKSSPNHGLMITATTRKPTSDIRTMANNIERAMLKSPRFKQVASQTPEALTINGMDAVRFEVLGTLTGIFGQRITYFYTVLQGDEEIVVVNAYGPADFVESHRAEMQQFAGEIGGLRGSPQPGESKPPSAPEVRGEEPAGTNSREAD